MKKLASLVLVSATIGLLALGGCKQRVPQTQPANSVQQPQPAAPVTFTSEQEYTGEIPFEKSKNVVLHLTLSPDLKKVAKLELTTGKLYLTPQNFDEKRKDSKKESIFKSLKNTQVNMNMAIKTLPDGYRVLGDGIDNIQITGGGFEVTSPIDVTNGKVALNDRPLISDLTVADGYIYGTVKVELQGCGTKQVYVVLKNITTPKDVPQNILTPDKQS